MHVQYRNHVQERAKFAHHIPVSTYMGLESNEDLTAFRDAGFAGISWRGSVTTAISAASAMVRYWFVVVWCSKRNLEQSPVGHSTSILDLFGLPSSYFFYFSTFLRLFLVSLVGVRFCVRHEGQESSLLAGPMTVDDRPASWTTSTQHS